ncbi:MAG: transcription elongation factor GreA [Muribaculaceae bacterium]|nr:transcription elongation factor GreA [Muribaculaceae bacterium]MBR1476134.1 transcription elongation factor GreA [Muribaculaceae bacterium]MBR1725758.1 transcription elongation factor GreA [Muribaculaceae bacterium]
MAIVYMTQEGYDKKMAELNHLENVERPEVINAIREARDKGDLSENAEYDAAKERQGLLEAKIAELKTLVAGARIIDESKISTDEVQLLNRVTIKNVANGAKMTYTIVTETEANLREGKISITTPIAKGLLGHKVGEVVDVQAPAGKMQFEILDIAI